MGKGSQQRWKEVRSPESDVLSAVQSMAEQHFAAGVTDSGVILDPRAVQKAEAYPIARTMPARTQRVKDPRFNETTKLMNAFNVTPDQVKEVMQDAHFMSALNVRQQATIAREWELLNPREGGSDEALTFVSDMLERIDVYRVVHNALNAIGTGFSTQEVVLGRSPDGKLVPADVIGRPWDWFTFDQDWTLRFIPDTARPDRTVKMPEPRVLVHTHQQQDGDRSGTALARRAYWYVYFRRGVLAHGLLWLEQFATGHRTARVPQGWDSAKKQVLVDALAAMSNQTVTVYETPVELEVLKPGAASDSKLYREMASMLDRYISKLVVGGTLVTEGTEGGYGSRATAMAHVQNLRDLARGDAREVAATMNRLIRWLVALNFGDVPAPVFVINPEPPEVQIKQTAIMLEAARAGVEISKTAFYQISGIPAPAEGEETLDVVQDGAPVTADANTDALEGEAGGD